MIGHHHCESVVFKKLVKTLPLDESSSCHVYPQQNLIHPPAAAFIRVEEWLLYLLLCSIKNANNPLRMLIPVLVPPGGGELCATVAGCGADRLPAQRPSCPWARGPQHHGNNRQQAGGPHHQWDPTDLWCCVRVYPQHDQQGSSSTQSSITDGWLCSSQVKLWSFDALMLFSKVQLLKGGLIDSPSKVNWVNHQRANKCSCHLRRCLFIK